MSQAIRSMGEIIQAPDETGQLTDTFEITSISNTGSPLKAKLLRDMSPPFQGAFEAARNAGLDLGWANCENGTMFLSRGIGS